MNVLAVDTASDHGSAVVQIGDIIAAEVRPGVSIQYSEHLFETMDVLFGQAGIALDDIDIFAAARGPGSFTGLRVGLATMEGLAFAKGKRSYGVTNLAALAWRAGQSDGLIASILDARRGEIYGALFRREGQELIEVSPPVVLQPAEWLKTLSPGPTVFCAGCADDHPWLIRAIETRETWEFAEVGPHLAASVARMAAAGGGEPLEPMYLRRTSAEIHRQELCGPDATGRGSR